MNRSIQLATAASHTSFTFRQLECFVAVAEAGSIARAAIRLQASDSAVSDSLTSLERALGAELLRRRRSQGASLTSDGLTVLPIARRLLDEAEVLAGSLGRGPAPLVGPVRIGATATIAPVLVPSLVRATNELHPGLSVEFRSEDLPELFSALSDAKLDLVLGLDAEVPSEFDKIPIMTVTHGVVLHAGHPLSARASLSLRELADEPMILLDIASSRLHTLELMSSHSVAPNVAYRTDNYELCRALVGQGLGYSLLMQRQIDPHTWDGGEVVYIPILPRPKSVDVVCLTRIGTRPARVDAVRRIAIQIGAEMSAAGNATIPG